MITTDIILLLIFISYLAFRSLGEIIDNGILVRLYFERRRLIHLWDFRHIMRAWSV